ncbi:MAG: ABC transporter substrate-binding protein, partial [Lachnospiraceae bacterium]|nr:ABC transporter substrate-binding protein [Lachnospiraceae bacterium]
TALEALGFTLADFDPNDMSTWEPLFAAYVEANPGKYPLNVEGEVIDRAYNHVINVVGTNGPIGVVFDNANPAGTAASFISRYENPVYKDFVTTMNGFYNAGYVDPDQGIPETAGNSVSTRRDSGDFLVSTFAYAPGAENMISASASAAQGSDVVIAWAPSWSSPIASSESAIGSGLAVYAGTQYAPEAVTFLNLMASDAVIGNLMAEGVEGEGYTVTDGVAWRTADRGGWANWRYGVVGNTSAATPLGDVEANGNEWVNQKAFNNSGVGVKSGLFNNVEVIDAYNACQAVIESYAVPFGSGALDVSNYDAFIAELKAAGVDTVLEAALSQQADFFAQ